MGEVYRATDSVLERPVAVKLLSELYAREPESRARFQREALAAARLSRERHVVTVFDVGEHYGRPLIVMEYVDGGSVHDRLAQGAVSHEQALDWVEQVGQALDRAHASGIVHRDVKPSNLLLDSEGNIRVSDFGIASAAGLETVTLPGTVLGTAGYISPEQARGEPATPASDRYSLGVIAFELLTGRRPFEGDTPATQAFAHVNASLPSAERLDSTLPRGIDDVLARVLAKDPADRPESCAELVAQLREAFASADGQAPVATGVPIRDAGRRSTPGGETDTTKVLARSDDRPRRDGAESGVRGARRAAPASMLAGTRSSVRRFFERPTGDPRSAAAVALVAILVVGLAGFALLGAGDGSDASEPRARAPVSSGGAGAPDVDGAALNARGFARMQAGDFGAALPLLRQAVAALKGSGTLDEAYASYNLASTRFALDRCDGVIGLLDRSERIQGDRVEIDRLRGEWERRCVAPAAGAGGDDPDEDEKRGPGGGKGPGKGKGKGRGDD